MNRKYFIVLLLSMTIGIVVALGPPFAHAQQNNSIDSIRVIILKNFPPQFVTTPDGPSGLAVEVMREVAQRASLEIEFVTLDSWKEVYDPLKNGTVDVISNMGISEARKKILEFTDPYEVFDIKIFVRTETNNIKSIDDLKGRLLGVQATNVLTKGLVKSGKYQIKQYASFKLALLGLLSGEVDAVPAPTEPFLLIARGARLDDRIKFVGPSLLEVKRAIALPKGRIELRDRLNKSLREFKQTDDYQKLLTKWYGSTTPYWTTTRLVMLMGVVFSASLLFMGIWRYYSLIGLNRRIHESEERFRTIYENAPVFIDAFDENGGCVLWNKECHKIFGWTIDEINAHDDALMLFYPDPAVRAEVMRTVTDPDGRFREWHPLTKDGRTLTTMWANFRLPEGIVFSLGYDITERKQAEETLQRSEALLNTTQRLTKVGGWEWEVEKQIMFWTDEVYRIHDFQPSKFVSGSTKHIERGMECYDPEDRSIILEAFRNCVEKGQSYDLEFPFTTLKGRQIRIRTVAEPIMKHDRVVRVVGNIMDITKRKQAEEELKKYREHLEELVKQRTDELKEKGDKIEESRKALTYLLEDVNSSREVLQKVNSEYAAVNNELKEFAYIVSHDLKAPLRAISQLTHWISEDYSEAFDDNGKMQMDLILQRVKRMDGLIEGILRYSRAGRIKEKGERLDLNLLVSEVIDSIASLDNIQIIIENKLPVVLGDSTRMEQVFQNLIGDAIKFMDKGEGLIKVGCVDKGASWQFSVSDNGPGIDKKYHDRIFQIFQTLTPRDEHESTGIGLSLVKKIIGLYGGSVWLESELDHGTTFFFTLPKKGEQDEKH